MRALHRIILSLLCAGAAATACAADEDCPSYSRTLSGDRYSALADISRANVKTMQVTCTFDTGTETSFQSGIIEVGGALYGTTETDTFAVDPTSCAQLWRVHENYESASELKVNRGLGYLDGRLFRGTQDARVLAYEAKTGKRLGEARIGDPKIGETVPAAQDRCALGGGVITYRVKGVQRIAVAGGMTSPIWPTEKTTAKIMVLSVAP